MSWLYSSDGSKPELSYTPAELFNICLKVFCFLYCWKVSSLVPVFKNVGKKSTGKNYHPVSLLSVVSKVFEKLVNNRMMMITACHPRARTLIWSQALDSGDVHSRNNPHRSWRHTTMWLASLYMVIKVTWSDIRHLSRLRVRI